MANNATRFTAADNEYAEVADTSLCVSATGQSMMFGGWFNFASAPTDTVFLLVKGSVSGVPTLEEYGLYYYPPGGVLKALVSNGSADTFTVGLSFSPVVGTWYFIPAWYDAVAGTINVQVNNGTPDSASSPGIAPNATYPLRVASDGNGTPTANTFDGKANSVFAIQRATAFTSTERTWLYNGGTGRIAADLGQSGTGGEFLAPAAGKGDWWNLNESGTPTTHVGAFNGVVLANAAGAAAPTQVAGGIPRLASASVAIPPLGSRFFDSRLLR